MLCKKCKKEVPDAPFCCLCGKRQELEKKKTRRRARGTGTISKDPRYKNQWRALAPPAIKGTNGKCIGYFATVKEAQQALENYLNEKRPDLYNATLSDIYKLWSEKHFVTLTDSGRVGYTSAYTDLSDLSSRKMRELKTADFQRCIDTVAAKYSRSKCEKVRQLCSQLCKYAMQNDVMDKNYASFLVLPKEEKKEKQIFTAAERQKLWRYSADKRVRFILFMIYTGFRIGEVSEITPERVHLNEGYIIGGLKTEAGKNRLVPLPPSIPEITDFVRAWLTGAQPSPFGVPKNSLRQYWFYPALSDLGMIDPPVYNHKSRKNEYKDPRLTPHAARHTFASLSAAAGMPPETLQKIIGHADYSTTADIYVHKDTAALFDGMGMIKK